MPSSRRHSATRRFSPPDRLVTRRSSGGQRSASIAISTLRSRLQASAAAILSSSSACSLADLVVVGVGVGPHRHDLVVPIDDRLHLGDAVHHVALDVLGGIELGLLRQVADREPGRETGLAREAVVESGHDLQQARLAGAVGADHADLGARVERQRDVLEHRPVGRVVPGQLVTGVDELVRHGARGYRWPSSALARRHRESTGPRVERRPWTLWQPNCPNRL